MIASAEELRYDLEDWGVMLTSETWGIYFGKTNIHSQFIGSLSTPPSSSSAPFTFQQPQGYLQPNHPYELHPLLHTKTFSVRQWKFHATVPPILFDSLFFAWEIRYWRSCHQNLVVLLQKFCKIGFSFGIIRYCWMACKYFLVNEIPSWQKLKSSAEALAIILTTEMMIERSQKIWYSLIGNP
jgi:hypothetical protein